MVDYKRTLTIDDLTPKRLREFYLFGLNLVDSNGKQMPDESIQNQIDASISILEDKCSTRFQPTKIHTPPDPDNIEEDMVEGANYDEIGSKINWTYNDQKNYGYIHLPVNKLISVQRIRGCYERKAVWEVPQQWIKPRLASIQIVPTITGAVGIAMNQQGVTFNASILHAQFSSQYPQYWAIDYTYGHAAIPLMASEYILLTASIYVIEQYATAFSPGIAGKSMSISGISQSVQYTASAEYSLFSAMTKTIHDRLTEKKDAINIDELIRKIRGIKIYST